ncbi:conserved hypothetical protein [Desulfatibacillum aliphaticivorans]|uniref:Uncharacterized protein n=1 Tax=Desulfatibacillum aliphaticivorans TaxID=218208 RepID=B8FB57_DESAL|nr:hypothetical protein [Desulfatibacillum aliphaticivorans]ACL04143.1 conserved hypothetical protein [Desulfatibacillum aliphaticivorans]
MYLSAFLHRDELFEITNRWLCDDFKPTDPLQITRIITYDSFAGWEALLHLTQSILTRATGRKLHEQRVKSKRELKDFLCHSARRQSLGIQTLIEKYTETPEFYYVGAPMAGIVFHDEAMNVLGACRFKKARRIAEKSNRYASRHIFEMVREKGVAQMEAWEKQGVRNGIDPQELYEQAEKQVMQEIRTKGLLLPEEPMTIKDVLGLKIVDLGFGEKGLEQAIKSLGGVEVVEKERHSGNYNAVHYVIRMDVDFPELCEKFRQNGKGLVYAQRGLPGDRIHQDFEDFMETGAKDLYVDLIFTTYEEMIQSEIGRSMHETRIFAQRSNQRVFGNIPVNIEYLMEYLLAVGLSPKVELEDIPIKIWGRYLPETLAYCIRKLFGMPEYSLMGF